MLLRNYCTKKRTSSLPVSLIRRGEVGVFCYSRGVGILHRVVKMAAAWLSPLVFLLIYA
ncbi:hypothetical protein BCR42DRAFT_420954 [Absidia repens]|uniref:Uncharacterized protein n=1 Tax=Absidia repens TaxID=90262 RepID=A0A1X2I922_9FUNG|nr:hypothetical protein BCR42DRAFT_420954 [Absidia repens]